MQSTSGIKRGRSPSTSDPCDPCEVDATQEQIALAVVDALERNADEEAATLIETAKLTSLQLCTGVVALTRLLGDGRCPTLVHLDLVGESLADEDGAAERLAAILPTLHLQSLSLEDCGCTPQQLDMIVRAVAGHPSLHRLHIDSSSAEGGSPPWVASLAAALPGTPALGRLSLAGCDLECEGIQCLAQALPRSHVHELCLCGGLRDAQAPLVKALVEGLQIQAVALRSPMLSRRDDYRREINRILASGRVCRMELDAWLFKPEHLPELCEALRQGGSVIGLSEYGTGPVLQPEVQLLLIKNLQLRSMAILSQFIASVGQPPCALMPVGDHLTPSQMLGLAQINRSTRDASHRVLATLARHQLKPPGSDR